MLVGSYHRQHANYEFEEREWPPLVFAVLDEHEVTEYDNSFPADKFDAVHFIKLPRDDAGLGVAHDIINIVASALGLKRYSHTCARFISLGLLVRHWHAVDDLMSLRQWESFRDASSPCTILRGLRYCEDLLDMAQGDGRPRPLSSMSALDENGDVANLQVNVFLKWFQSIPNAAALWKKVLRDLLEHDDTDTLMRLAAKHNLVNTLTHLMRTLV